MANRFNVYQNVDYVHLPIEAYQMGLGITESENLQRLQSAKEQYDMLKAIKASHTPDQLLKEDLMGKITQGISGLSTQDLRGQDTMAAVNKLVNDPDTVSQLANIQGNTIIHDKNTADREAYIKETGNDINTVEFDDKEATYNKLGKEGFKANFMSGWIPGKFVDVEKEAREAFDKAKDSGYTYDRLAGGWILRHGDKGMSLSDLLVKVNPVLADPKFSKQLQSYNYYEMRKWGDPSDPATAFGNYNKDKMSKIGDINTPGSDIGKAASHLTSINAEINKLLTAKKLLPEGKKHSLDRKIENARANAKGTTDLIETLNETKNKYATDTKGNMMGSDVLQRLAMGTVAPLVHSEKEDLIMGPNPYDLLRLKHEYAKDLFDYKQKQTMTVDTTNPLPDMTSTIAGVNPDGSPRVVPGFVLDEKGGFNTDKVKSTMLALLNNVTSAYDKDNNLITMDGLPKGFSGASSKTYKSVVSAEINAGTAKVIPIGSTGEYSILSPTLGNIRISMDEGTKNYPPIKSLQITTDLQPGDRTELPMSLDGRSFHTVIVQKVNDKDVSYYTPQVDSRQVINGKPNPGYGREVPFLSADAAFNNLNHFPKIPKGTPDEEKAFIKNYWTKATIDVARVLTGLLGVPINPSDVPKFNTPRAIIAVDVNGRVYDTDGNDYVPPEVLRDPKTKIVEVNGTLDPNDYIGTGSVSNIRIRPISSVNYSQSTMEALQWKVAAIDPNGPLHFLVKPTETKISLGNSYRQSTSQSNNNNDYSDDETTETSE